MSCLSVTDQYIATAKGLQIDLYDHCNHILIDIPSTAANDQINSVAVSSDNKYLAVSTNLAKQLLLYQLPEAKSNKVFALPRSSSKMRFTPSNTCILLADKSGDVLSFDISVEDKVEQPIDRKILGHLSLILDVLQTSDNKYIVSSDRDEKIKVSCFPNVFNIQTYCLGHKEYVNHIEELPHNGKYLLSSSGDGTVKVWDFVEGKNQYTIDTNLDVNAKLKENFKETMNKDDVPVDSLPVVHLAATKLNEDCSILAVYIHTFDMILIYSLRSSDGKLTHKLESKLNTIKVPPTAIQFIKSSLVVYHDSECTVTFFNMLESNGTVSFEKDRETNVFDSSLSNQSFNQDHFDTIKSLFKRKFDNVQEYQERKKQRIEKSSIKTGV